jgi:hypothetical protein
VKEARAVLADLGVNNLLRAEFISELAQAVVADKQPILCQQRPKVRPVQDKFWRYAFVLVRDYLSENALTLTQQTADVEFPEFSSQSAPLTSASSTERIQQVIDQQSDHPFEERVDEQFSGKKATAAEPGEQAPAKGAGKPSGSPAPTRGTKKRSAAADGEKPAPKGKGKGTKGSKAPGKAKASARAAKVVVAKEPQPPADEGDDSSNSFGD